MSAKPRTDSNWFLTYTGRKFYPLDPRPEDIDIRDIAHALARICRFGGHCRWTYSVGQHSLLVARLLPPSLQLQGLLHDAAEAYLGDMVKPLKVSMPEYREVEAQVWWAISNRFPVPQCLHPEVKCADNIALVTERRDIMVDSPHRWDDYYDIFPAAERREWPLPAWLVEWLFLRKFRRLMKAEEEWMAVPGRTRASHFSY